MQIFSSLSPNQALGRSGYKPEAFVIHVTEGGFIGALEWCKDRRSEASYHFIVREDGFIFKLVEPENTAWHAGAVKNSRWRGLKAGINPNLYTIGISYAGFASKGPTLAQFLAIKELICQLSAIHSILLDRNHIIGHYEIRSDKTCPGAKMNLDALVYLTTLSINSLAL
jgi:N-acetyl-anhydromuramyl-L-alanine amidase AmpD